MATRRETKYFRTRNMYISGFALLKEDFLNTILNKTSKSVLVILKKSVHIIVASGCSFQTH